MGRKGRLPKEPVEADIQAFSHEGRGITHDRDRPVFVDFALPGERVRFQYKKLRRSRGEGVAVEVLTPAPERIAPACSHFGTCGGCALQHLPPSEQRRHKADMVSDLMERIGRVQPERWLEPLVDSAWGYRRRARLAVKHVPRKGGVLVGFREKHSPLVAQIERCPVLDPRVGERLQPLARLIESLSRPDRIPQIEVACGDADVALVFRNLDPLTDADHAALSTFGREHRFFIYHQPGDESTVTPIHPEAPELTYALHVEGGQPARLELAFLPTDFVQIHAGVNQRMIRQALDWLQPAPGQRVLDLFCGMGNFSLPLAARGATVCGLEGDAGLVERARTNAERNGIAASFGVADLTEPANWPVPAQPYDAVVLDPPRTGAQEVLPAVAATGAHRVVYCSCGPATFARDAGLLVHEHGFRLRAAGIMDMFPHTAHVEVFAVFERDAAGARESHA